MSFSDRIRRIFAKKSSPQLSRLEAFVAERRGVEGYIEPRTSTNPLSLLLVDRDGDFVRAPVDEPEDATRFCKTHKIPVYDAAVLGYPERMRTRNRGVREDLDSQIADLERRLSESGPDIPDR